MFAKFFRFILKLSINDIVGASKYKPDELKGAEIVIVLGPIKKNQRRRDFLWAELSENWKGPELKESDEEEENVSNLNETGKFAPKKFFPVENSPPENPPLGKFAPNRVLQHDISAAEFQFNSWSFEMCKDTSKDML